MPRGEQLAKVARSAHLSSDQVDLMVEEMNTALGWDIREGLPPCRMRTRRGAATAAAPDAGIIVVIVIGLYVWVSGMDGGQARMPGPRLVYCQV